MSVPHVVSTSRTLETIEPYNAMWQAIEAYATAVAATADNPSHLLRRIAASEVERRISGYVDSHVAIARRESQAGGDDG